MLLKSMMVGDGYSKSERKKKAIECFQASLKLNPFLWSSFEMLCELGLIDVFVSHFNLPAI